MFTTLELAKMIKEANCNNGEPCSDYRLAQLLDIPKQTVSSWKTSGCIMKDETGLKAAKLLGLGPELVLAGLQVERAKDTPAYKSWKKIYKAMEQSSKGVAAAALLAVFVIPVAICNTPIV